MSSGFEADRRSWPERRLKPSMMRLWGRIRRGLGGLMRERLVWSRGRGRVGGGGRGPKSMVRLLVR